VVRVPRSGRVGDVSGAVRRGRARPDIGERIGTMLAAIGLGLLGTILVIVLVIAAIMFFLRRA